MARKNCLTLFAFLLVISGTAHASNANVEVFSASSIKLKNVPVGAVVVELDSLAGLDEVLSLDLPSDPARAQAVAQQRIGSSEWTELSRRYEHAAMGVARAWSLGVEKLPAVVVNGRHVVYGQDDIAAAVKLIEEEASR